MPTGLLRQAMGESTRPQGLLSSAMQESSRSTNFLSLSAPATSLKDQVALAAGREAAGDAGNFFTKLLTELVRPQKAVFAALYTQRIGGTPEQAKQAFMDELELFGTGRLARDVQFSDIIKPVSTPEERSFLLKTVGLVGDLVLDPLIVASKVGLTRAAFSGAKSLASMGFAQSKKLPIAGKGLEFIEEQARKTFTSHIPESPIGEAGSDVARRLRSLFEIHKDAAITEAFDRSKLIRELAEDLGMGIDDAEEVLLAQMTKKYSDELYMATDGKLYTMDEAIASGVELPPDALRISSNLEDDLVANIRTLEDELPEMGMADYVAHLEDQGLNMKKAILNEKPIRENLISRNLDQLEVEMGKQIRPELRPQVEELISEMRDGSLLRMVDETTTRLRVGKKFGDVEDIKLQLRNSVKEEYIHFSVTTDAQGVLSRYPQLFGNVRKWGFEFSPNHAATLRRNIDDLGGLKNANDLAQAGELRLVSPEGVEVHIKEKFVLFDTNPAYLDSVRGYYANKAITSLKTLEEFVEQNGVVFTDDARKALKDEGSTVAKALAEQGKEGWTNVGIPGFRNVYLPSDAADLLSRHFSLGKDPDTANEFLKAVGSLQNVWKVWTTMPFVAFHVRNLIGNQWNKHLAGMPIARIPQYEALAANLISHRLSGKFVQRAADVLADIGKPLAKKFNAGSGTLKLGDNTFQIEELLTDMVENGLLRTGQFGGAEIRQSIDRAAKAGLGTLSTAAKVVTIEGNPLLRGGLRIAAGIEDLDRASMYLWGLDNGLNQKQARDLVFDYLFDYDALTDRERSLRRFVAPFYTWTRKNIPLQLEHLVKDPHKFSALLKIKNSYETDAKAGRAPDDRFLSEYIRNGLSIRTEQLDDGTYNYWLLNNWIPAADIVEIDSLEGIGKLVVNLLGPAWKVPIEQIAGEYLFFEREFGENQGKYLGIHMPDRAQSLLRNIRLLSTIDRISKNVDASDDPALSQIVTQMKETLTGLRTYNQNTKAGARSFFFEQDQKVREVTRGLRREIREGPSFLESIGVQDERSRLLERLREIRRGE